MTLFTSERSAWKAIDARMNEDQRILEGKVSFKRKRVGYEVEMGYEARLCYPEFVQVL